MLQVLDASAHVLGGCRAPQVDEAHDDSANRLSSGRTIRDASVVGPQRHQSQEPAVVSHEHSVGSDRVLELPFIACADKTGLCSRRRVDASLSQSAGDRVVNAVIEVEY